MATINGVIANEKSMSGVVESPIGDVIECQTLIADSVESQNIYAQDGLVDCSLFNNDFATITLGNSATNLMNLGAFQFLLDTIRHITSTLNLYLFPTTTGVINFATSASQILFGSSTALTSAFVPTASNHLTNKQYVDSVVGSNLIPLNNTWTGTNTFSTPTNTPSFKIDNTGGFVELDFLTNPLNVTQKTGKIIASATGGVNSTALSYSANDHTFYGELYQLISNLYPVRWGVYSGASSIGHKFNTNPSSVGTTTYTMTASGGTTPNTGTLTMTGATTDIACDNVIVGDGGGNVTINGANTYLNSYMYINTPTTSAIFLNLASGAYPVFANIPMITFAATATTMTFSNITQGMTYYYSYTRTTPATITLSDTIARDGNYVYIINQANANVVISCASARLFGNSVTRGGVTSRTLTPNTACKITCYMDLGGRMGNSALTFGYFIQTMT